VLRYPELPEAADPQLNKPGLPSFFVQVNPAVAETMLLPVEATQ
jgi:hypothetical protein